MFTICHVNIVPIAKHKDELIASFSKYDIISVDETNLRSEHPFSGMGYKIFRNVRVGKLGDEVLVAVKEHIKCREVLNKPPKKNEAIVVEIETKPFKSILISSIHVPPTAKIDLSIFHDNNNNCIIVGDLNATLFERRSRRTQMLRTKTASRNNYVGKVLFKVPMMIVKHLKRVTVRKNSIGCISKSAISFIHIKCRIPSNNRHIKWT